MSIIAGIYGGLSPIIITVNKLVLVDILLDAYSKQPLFFTTGNFKKGKKNPHLSRKSLILVAGSIDERIVRTSSCFVSYLFST